jgi:preprotein translocase subunit SecD
MYKRTGRRLVFIFILSLISLLISLPKQIPLKIHQGPINIEKTFVRQDLNLAVGNITIKRSFDLKLGLDLVGGSHLVFEADMNSLPEDKRGTALEGVRDVIEKRVNLFGVSEPNIQTSRFEGKERIIVELPGINDTKEAIDLVGKTAQLVFAEVVSETEPLKITDLTGADLESAAVVFDQVSGKPAVGIEFSDEGGKKFEVLTEKNIGKPLVILLDDQIVSAPVVEEKIAGGSAQIKGEFSLEEAKKLTIQLNAGALPVPVELVEERTVGATLGSESIKKSVEAGLVGIAMVLVFMIIMYGKLGLIADVGLIIFGILTLALYKIIPVVLTLPGIAGFLLSVGMAVDANILIFERFREEKAKGINTIYALETSFGRAWDSIRDANIATLVTAFILANPLDWQFLHTSGPVRGFAITLALGIGVSLFTGIVVSRNLLRVFIKK